MELLDKIYDMCTNNNTFIIDDEVKHIAIELFAIEQFDVLVGVNQELLYEDEMHGDETVALYVNQMMAEQEASDRKIKTGQEVAILTVGTREVLERVLRSKAKNVKVYCNYYTLIIGIDVIGECIDEEVIL